MVSKQKLYSKLDALESELEERLIPHLENAVNGKNDLIFCVNDFNPYKELKHKTDKTTQELVSLGAQILALKNKLGEPSEASIAERICWYCRKWGDTNNHHRGSGEQLAKDFLKEITSK